MQCRQNYFGLPRRRELISRAAQNSESVHNMPPSPKKLWRTRRCADLRDDLEVRKIACTPGQVYVQRPPAQLSSTRPLPHGEGRPTRGLPTTRKSANNQGEYCICAGHRSAVLAEKPARHVRATLEPRSKLSERFTWNHRLGRPRRKAADQ